jgi:hypothetical protein
VEQAEDRALARMWGAYCHKAGGKTFDGKPLPTWAELGEERQACVAAADLRAVRDPDLTGSKSDRHAM